MPYGDSGHQCGRLRSQQSSSLLRHSGSQTGDSRGVRRRGWGHGLRRAVDYMGERSPVLQISIREDRGGGAQPRACHLGR